ALFCRLLRRFLGVWSLLSLIFNFQPYMVLAAQRARRAHQRAHGLGDPPLPADDLAQVLTRDMQANYRGVAVVANLVDADGVGIIHEVARDKLDQAQHAIAPEKPLAGRAYSSDSALAAGSDFAAAVAFSGRGV